MAHRGRHRGADAAGDGVRVARVIESAGGMPITVAVGLDQHNIWREGQMLLASSRVSWLLSAPLDQAVSLEDAEEQPNLALAWEGLNSAATHHGGVARSGLGCPEETKTWHKGRAPMRDRRTSSAHTRQSRPPRTHASPGRINSVGRPSCHHRSRPTTWELNETVWTPWRRAFPQLS
jgi:hypothetical protein